LKAENDAVQREQQVQAQFRRKQQEESVAKSSVGASSHSVLATSAGADGSLAGSATASSSSSALPKPAVSSVDKSAAPGAKTDDALVAKQQETLAASTEADSKSVENASKDADETPPKVFNVLNMPDTDSMGEEASALALEVAMDTELPALAALFGVAASNVQLPSITNVRLALGVDSDQEVKQRFEVDGVQSYGDRAYEIRGKLQPVGAAAATGLTSSPEMSRAGELTSMLQARLDDLMPIKMELFAQPGAEDDEVRLFVFAKDDLPTEEVDVNVQQLSGTFGVLTVILCNQDYLIGELARQQFLLPKDWWDFSDASLGVDAENIWPAGPLLVFALVTSLALRKGVAESHGVKDIHQVTLPSAVMGHIGSIWTSNGTFLSSQRANFDISAAAPAAVLLLSSACLAVGASQVRGLELQEAPLQVPAIELPAILAAWLGYPIPVSQEVGDSLPLLGLGTPLTGPQSPLVNAASQWPMVPVDAFVLAGAGGLAAAAASLLPMSGFDGYRLAQAAFGASTASFLEIVALWSLLSEVGRDDARGTFAGEVLLIWTIQWVVGNRRDEAMPPRDSVTPLDPARQAAAAVLLSSGFLILAPPLAPMASSL